MMQLILLLLLALFGVVYCEKWQIDRQPHYTFSYEEGGYNVLPNKNVQFGDSIAVDAGYFRMLYNDPKYIVIGGRNFMVSVEYSTWTVTGFIEWNPSQNNIDDCIIKGMSEKLCGNFITVSQPFTGQERYVMVCGTHAASPKCSNFTRTASAQYTEGELLTGSSAIASYFPTFSDSYVFNGDNLYSAVHNGFTGNKWFLYSSLHRLTQIPREAQHLHHPNFIKTIHHNGFVYFFFSEAQRGDSKTRLKARVNRICANDTGIKNIFSTLLKVELSCFAPVDRFHFNELKSVDVTYDSGLGRGSPLVYGVFSTSLHSAPGSAVCAYSLDDIDKVMDEAVFNVGDETFKYGGCNGVGASDRKPSVYYNNPLIAKKVKPTRLSGASGTSTALAYRTTAGDLFTHVTVLPVKSAGQRTKMDVLFIATEGKRVIKALIGESMESGNVTMLSMISTAQLPPSGGDLVELVLSGDGLQLVVLRDKQLQAFPTAHCSNLDCDECIAVRDPHCGWLAGRGCVDVRTANSSVLQSLSDGVHDKCPRIDTVNPYTSTGISTEVPIVAKSISEEEVVMSTSPLGLLIGLPLVVLLLGFVLGCVSHQLLTHCRVCRQTAHTSCSCWPRLWRLPGIKPLAHQRKGLTAENSLKRMMSEEFAVYVDSVHRTVPVKSVNVVSNGCQNEYNSVNVNVNSPDVTTQKVRKMYL